jgi:hypothetical protein
LKLEWRCESGRKDVERERLRVEVVESDKAMRGKEKREKMALIKALIP